MDNSCGFQLLLDAATQLECSTSGAETTRHQDHPYALSISCTEVNSTKASETLSAFSVNSQPVRSNLPTQRLALADITYGINPSQGESLPRRKPKKESCDSSTYLSVSQWLENLDDCCFNVSECSFSSADQCDNPANHSSSFTLRSPPSEPPSFMSIHPPDAKQFKKAATGYAGTAPCVPGRSCVANHSGELHQNRASSDPKLVDPAEHTDSQLRPSSRSKHHTSCSRKLQLSANLSQPRTTPYSLSAKSSSSNFGISNPPERSAASLVVPANISHGPQIPSTVQEHSEIFSKSFNKSICRATTSTPIPTRPNEMQRKKKSSQLFADETPVDLSLPKVGVNIGHEPSQDQGTNSSICRPMDLRIAKLADHEIDNHYEEDSCDEEDDSGGDPTFLNEFSIFECFEGYRNMQTDDEEFPDSDDDNFDLRPAIQQKCQGPKTKNDAGEGRREDEQNDSNELQKNEENETINTTHHNLENELNDPKIKKVSLRVRNKQLKLKGMSYTRPDGTVVPARSVKKGCECKMKCSEKYSDNVRQQLLRNLLALKMSGQNQFIANHMIITKTVHPKVVNSRRTYSRSYRLPGVSGMVKICKVMFMTTLDITDRKLRSLAAKKNCRPWCGRG